MKHLGEIPIALLRENAEYENAFEPLTEEEYADLLASIKTSGIINDIIVEKDGAGYVILSGYHRKRAAIELGLDKVPCSVIETVQEKITAIFDNALRRQLPERKRKDILKKRDFMQNNIIKEGLAPEIYDLYKQGRLPEEHITYLLTMSKDEQKALISSMAVIPPELLEQHNKEISNLSENMGKLQEERDIIRADLDEVNNRWKDKERELKVAMAKYEATKEKLEPEIKVEFEEQINQLRANIKGHVEEKDKLEKTKNELGEQIQALLNQIKSLEGEAGVWKQEVAYAKETFNHAIDKYSTPELVEYQLEGICQFLDALKRIVKDHMWDKSVVEVAKNYEKAMNKKMKELIGELEKNPKPDLSVEQIESKVRGQTSKRIQQAALGR